MNRSLFFIKPFKIIFLFACLFFSINASSQAPVINSFNPLIGPIGTTVSITGNNFDSNPTNNVVFFGATKAIVIASSNTQLTVIVPIGATYQLITVTVNGLTAYSKTPFDVTFLSPAFGANSLSPKIDFSAVSNISGTAAKDIDGDGKTDIVTVTGNSVSVFKNNSQQGPPDLAIALTKSLANYSVGVAVDDLNGDGKPDIVVANFNNSSISILKNTSVINQVSFDDAVMYATGLNAYNVTIADFNGDGKPDIAVTDQNNFSIAVFTNATVAGGVFSFLSAKYFNVQSTPRGISVGDIDMDGKPDIITANQSGSISILRNISSPGNIDFSPELDIALPGSSAESVAINDIDGDGKPDIAIANNNTAGTISILKNNSSPGTISFLGRQDFFVGKNPYSIVAGDINGDGKPDIAVCNQLSNSVSVLINTSVPGTVKFNNKVDFATGNFPRSTLIADINGNGKPDLIVGSNEQSILSVLPDNSEKQPSVISFQPSVDINIDADNVLHPVISSTNTETPITYTSSNPAVAYVGTDGLIHVIAPGSTVITANQSGNINYNPATPVSQTFVIKQNQVISFPVIGQKIMCDNDFSANALSTNLTLPLNYSSSNTTVATVSATGIIHITGAGTTQITATQNGNDLFNSAQPQQQLLTVNQPIQPTVNITANNGLICTGMPVKFTANVTNAGANPTYQWTVNNNVTGNNSATFTLNNPGLSDIIQCKVINTDACSVIGLSNTLTVQEAVKPSVSVTSSAQAAVCKNTPIIFTAKTINVGSNPTYQWLVNGNIIKDATASSYTSSVLLNGDIVACTIANVTAPCTVFNTVTSNNLIIEIAQPATPLVLISASANNVKSGVPITFTATCPIPVVEYQWMVNGKNSGGNSAVFNTNSLRNDDKVTCIITTNETCATPTSSQELIVNILTPPIVKITNAFTPNDDGINDTWEIPDLNFYPNCSVKIFNRNGEIIYQSIGYTKPWDGTFNRKQLPMGTYYYVIAKDPENADKQTGYITLIR